jgi:phenylacetate-coenzyme A ligase PaaK-like adenylate-forming protein
VPDTEWDIGQLPVTTKHVLMAGFDAAVTDRRVSWAALREFVDDPERIGRPFMGKYMAWRTSGTTGTPGVFLHDRKALEVYDALLFVRGWPSLMEMVRWPTFASGAVVLIAADGAHYAAISSWRRLEQAYPFFSRDTHVLPVTAPMPVLIEALNRLRPGVLVSYPSVLTLLARERQAGRLVMRPSLLVSCGERLSSVGRVDVETTFKCHIQDVYACSESDYIAFGCHHGRLHVNADWMIVEAVDAAYRPVAAGQSSHTTLLTNLANRIQPIIRYDVGDAMTIHEDRCPCGNALPTISINGRADDILGFSPTGGRLQRISPMAIADILERLRRLHRFQIIQTEPMSLAVRLEAEAGFDEADVWLEVRQSLSEFLAAHGLTAVAITRLPERPAVDPHTGKFRHVIRAVHRPGT